jgi:hypothetical protein
MVIILDREAQPCFPSGMAQQGPANSKAARRRPKSDVLTPSQAISILIIGGLVIFSMGVLYWKGFSIGKIVMPILIGLSFIVGMCYSIKTGVINWKGGGRMYRNQQPFVFWLWVSIFLTVGLLAIAMGFVGFFKN